ncbi:hypothetical protein K504DRAFT_539238 [Pleomassaria siparia CBS 279.74]|uniref:Uncharacterized protein n=1 Tax=Pleomassaria siparia CBS 279.74 TaxID=1314801 RepID=A0A6G1JS43_9PLEO|nr:hypothetical protein K504DRAFT_539238 [Pleomassaria siparia CBS 279.74]
MASSDGSSGGASQPLKPEATPVAIEINTKLSRRQLTLIAITALLHILLWGSLSTIVTSIYLIAADPNDTTMIPSEILTLTSAFVSLAYVVLHTVFSIKQRIWRHQRRNPSITMKTSYVAVRLAVTLCILWLLTSGWNLIIIARQPMCLPAAAELGGWEAGTTCVVGRVATAISLIVLIASLTLFGMLAVVRRPFEAHLLKYNYNQPVYPYPAPVVSRRLSPTRSSSFTSVRQHRRISVSTRRSTFSINTDVETLDIGSTSPPSTIHAPTPLRSTGLGTFTKSALPPAFMLPARASSMENLPQVFYPSISNHHLPPPPRMSTLVGPYGFVPLYNAKEYSASAWRAVHPTLPSPLRPVSYASRSNPHLPQTTSTHPSNFYRSGYSRSSVSLTRPNRLSSVTPPLPAGSVTWSSRSGSTGPEDGRQSRSPVSSGGGTSEKAFGQKMSTGTASSSANETKGERSSHARHTSAPDAMAGAAQQYPHSSSERKAKGWKPQLKRQQEMLEGTPAKIVRSSSAEVLGRPSHTSPEAKLDFRQAFEKELDAQWSIAPDVPEKEETVERKSKSASPLRAPKGANGDTGGGCMEKATMASRMPQYPTLKRMTFDEVKNKPLPRIAAL